MRFAWRERPLTPTDWRERPLTPADWRERLLTPADWRERPLTPADWRERPLTPADWGFLGTRGCCTPNFGSSSGPRIAMLGGALMFLLG